MDDIKFLHFARSSSISAFLYGSETPPEWWEDAIETCQILIREGNRLSIHNPGEELISTTLDSNTVLFQTWSNKHIYWLPLEAFKALFFQPPVYTSLFERATLFPKILAGQKSSVDLHRFTDLDLSGVRVYHAQKFPENPWR